MKNCPKVPLILTLVMTIVLGLGSFSYAKNAIPVVDSTKVEEPIDFTESVKMEWPDNVKWVLEDTYTGNRTIMELYYPKGESSSNWSQMGSIEIAIGKIEGNVGGRARLIFLGTEQGSPGATWDIIKMDYNKELDFKWVVFEINCPEFLNGDGPQVQLWKIMSGKTGTFIVQYSYKGKEMPGLLKDQMIEALIASQLVKTPIAETEK